MGARSAGWAMNGVFQFLHNQPFFVIFAILLVFVVLYVRRTNALRGAYE